MLVPANDKVSILEQLESQGVSVKSVGCRDGYCGMCATEVVSGQVEEDDSAIGFKPKNHALICCSTAKTEVQLAL